MIGFIKELLSKNTDNNYQIHHEWQGYYDYIGQMQKILNHEIIGSEENYYFVRYWQRKYPNLKESEILNYEGLPRENI